MNSRYWGKAVIKLWNLANSVYNFSNNGSETDNIGIKISTLAREHVSTQDTLTREHVSTKGRFRREHVSMQGTLAREHESTQDTLAREHVFSTLGTQVSRLKNKLYKISDYWSSDAFNFDVLEKSIEIVSPLHSVLDFLKEKYFPSYILLTTQVSLVFCLYFLRYWAICVLWFLISSLLRHEFWNQLYLSNQVGSCNPHTSQFLPVQL